MHSYVATFNLTSPFALSEAEQAQLRSELLAATNPERVTTPILRGVNLHTVETDKVSTPAPAPSPKPTSLMCRIFGHKWIRITAQYVSSRIYMEEKACRRCGTPNPNY